jgi:hypothetical protein
VRDVEIAAMASLGLGLVVFGTLYVRDVRRRTRTLRASPKRILFPFAGGALSRRALEAALRLALADRATLVPVFLISVPMHLPLDSPRDSPLPRQCALGLSLLETIEQRGSHSACRSTRASSAAARSVMPCARRSRTSASTASSWRPPAVATRACTPTTSAGCSSTRPARWSSSARSATTASRRAAVRARELIDVSPSSPWKMGKLS